MNEDVYRFGACEVSATRREVVRDGRPQILEPKPFDVLVYLIRHRERVVSKDELLDRLWPQEFVTDSVIVRAIMKARQAIGDDAKEPALIRTVHRLGYRFVGELLQPADAAPQPAAAGAVSLALLPFDNLTGSAELDWVELGLMALSAKALGADTRLAVAETSSLLTALGSLAPDASLETRVQTVQRLLGVRHVVHAAVGRDGERFRLDWCIASTTMGSSRSLLGSEVTLLGHQLVREVERELFPQQAPPPLASGSSDPLAARALARAMQAVGEQKWKVAVNLLQVVLDIEPDNMAAQLERVWALANEGDDEALPAAGRLLAQAQASGDTMLVAMTHQALGWAYSTNKSMLEPAKHHLDESLRLAPPQGQQGWVAQAHILRAGIAIMQRDFTDARPLLERVRRVHEHEGNQVHSLTSTIYAALVHTKCGNPVLSLQLGQQAVRLAREFRLNSLFALASLNLSHTCMELGMVGAAIEHARDSLETSIALSSWRRAAFAADSLCWFYRELRAADEAASVLATMQSFEHELPDTVRTHLSMAHGHHAACRNEHTRAAALMRPPVEACIERGNWLTGHEMLPWLATACVQSGDDEAARNLIDRARALPRHDDDGELRAALLHAEALQAHRDGDTGAALQKLSAAVDAAPMGVWRAHAALDAAWLQLEAGDIDAAQRLLRDLGVWLNEHPAGIAVDARLKFATGRFAEAAEALHRHASMVRDIPAHLAGLEAACRAAAARMPATPPPWPRAPMFPTRM